jgi:ABC-type transport system involved in multi-copper enzyme maturation permease subunit
VSFGLVGIAIASWRLRPACLQQVTGEARGKTKRRFVIPPVGDRPMLWKELFIDRVGALGRVGRWLGLLMALLLTGVGALMAILYVFGADVFVDWGISGWLGWLGRAVANTGIPLVCLIQWAIGLRAAVTISSERERGTWDGLLTSPLEGVEIVVGKLWGSLFSLRWLLLATLWMWAMACIAGSLKWDALLIWSLHVFIIGAFIAAVGVRCSLASQTATRAMAVTIGIWLGAYAASFLAAGIIGAIASIFGFLFWMLGMAMRLIPQSARPLGLINWVFWIASHGSLLGAYVIATLMIVSESRLRFDRIAGRMTGGEVEVEIDRLFHGLPLAPTEDRMRTDAIGAEGDGSDPAAQPEEAATSPVG